MRIGSSTSLFTEYALSRTSAAISRSLKRLSTGLRVNSPSDDAGAYSLGVNLDSQIRGYTQATRNVNDAQGLLQTASDAISSQIEIVQKMRELAVQASNGSLTTIDRAGINQAIQNLFQEFARITSTTQFNGIHLLDGSFLTRSIQLGANAGDALDIAFNSSTIDSVFKESVGTGTFHSGATLSAGTNTRNSQIVDVNGDGKVDIVEVDSGNATASVFLGKGDGTFQTRTTFTVGTTPTELTVQDLNHDGILDIVTTDYGAAQLSILLGNGDGTFKARTTLSAGTQPHYVKAVDFNNDGHLDLISAALSDGNFYINFGNGDGTFQTKTAFASGTSTYRIDTQDINGDGNADVVVSNASTAAVSVYLGNGNGTFLQSATLTTGIGPGDIFARDFNRDGKIDLVVSNTGTNTVSVFIGNGNGTFSAGTTLTTVNSDNGMDVGDVNGDGILDLILAEYATANTVSIYLGNGDATFRSRSTLATGASPVGVKFGDLNGDGVQDFLVHNNTGSNITMYLGNSVQVTAQSDITIGSQTDAQALIQILDASLARLQQSQGQVAALHDRLDITAAQNQLFITNLSEAKDRALDVDLALETSELVRNQILQQAQVAALSQGNINSQLVLKLLEHL